MEEWEGGMAERAGRERCGLGRQEDGMLLAKQKIFHNFVKVGAFHVLSLGFLLGDVHRRNTA